jgi:MtN3 and saliva related transmembrane protein
MKSADVVGWASSVILLLTIGRQVYTQWKTKATSGVSRWLFIGQLTASAGFSVYSYLLDNWVFLTSNVALLVTAIFGEVLYLRNKGRFKKGEKPPGERQTP